MVIPSTSHLIFINHDPKTSDQKTSNYHNLTPGCSDTSYSCVS